MPSNTGAFPGREQADIELPLEGAPERGRIASRLVFAPSLSQVAAFPKRWREGSFRPAVGQVDAG